MQNLAVRGEACKSTGVERGIRDDSSRADPCSGITQAKTDQAEDRYRPLAKPEEVGSNRPADLFSTKHTTNLSKNGIATDNRPRSFARWGGWVGEVAESLVNGSPSGVGQIRKAEGAPIITPCYAEISL
jgi:hypothetical protein